MQRGVRSWCLVHCSILDSAPQGQTPPRLGGWCWREGEAGANMTSSLFGGGIGARAECSTTFLYGGAAWTVKPN